MSSSRAVGESISRGSREDIDYARNTLLYGAKFDPDYPEESIQEVELKKDLDYLSAAPDREDFVARGNYIMEKWERRLEDDPYGQNKPSQHSWGNPYSIFRRVLEDERELERIEKRKKKR